MKKTLYILIVLVVLLSCNTKLKDKNIKPADVDNPKDGDLLANTFFENMKTHVPSPKNYKFYFDYGTATMDKFYPKYAPTVNSIFKDKGYEESNFRNLRFEGAEHTEISWQKRLDIPLTFFVEKDRIIRI